MTGTMRKRARNVWEITASLGKDEKGIRRRKSRTVYGTNRKQAEPAAHSWMKLSDRPRRGVVPFSDWLRTWHREDVAPRLRIKTQERYADIIEQNLIPHLGDVPLADLSAPPHRGRLPEPAGRRLRRHYDPADQLRDVRGVQVRGAQGATRPQRGCSRCLAPSHQTGGDPTGDRNRQQLLSLAEAEDHPLFPFLFVLAYTGMRKGELWGLTWRHVDLVGALIHVVEGTVRSRKQGKVTYRPKTDKGVRSIELPDVAVGFLRDHRLRQVNQSSPTTSSFRCRGDMMPETTMMRQLKHLGARVDFPDITFHASALPRQRLPRG